MQLFFPKIKQRQKLTHLLHRLLPLFSNIPYSFLPYFRYLSKNATCSSLVLSWKNSLVPWPAPGIT